MRNVSGFNFTLAVNTVNALFALLLSIECLRELSLVKYRVDLGSFMHNVRLLKSRHFVWEPP